MTTPEWTHVERHKARKRGAKRDVRSLHVPRPKHDVVFQASMLRFMYVNSEIVERKGAINIDVSPSLV